LSRSRPIGSAVITGGSGFAGRYLAERLIRDCSAVHLMDKSGSMPPGLIKYKDKITVHHVDLTAPRGLAQILEEIAPREIYHLAGIANVKHSWEGEAITFKVNVLGAVNLIAAVRHSRLNSDILVVGSGEVYGDVPEDHQPIVESWPVAPRSPYAASKVCQEVAVRQMSHHIKGKVVYARPFNHVGPGQNPSFVTSDFARQVAEIEQKKRAPRIQVGNLTTYRDFSDVRDTVEGYVRALRFGKDQGIYNVGSGKTMQIRSILDYFLTSSNAEINVVIDKNKFRPADVQMLCGSSNSLRKDTGWEPVYDIHQTLLKILEFWRGQTRSEKEL